MRAAALACAGGVVAAAAADAASAPAPSAPQPTTTITVDWATQTRVLQTSLAFQTVVNPVTTRESPYHDAV